VSTSTSKPPKRDAARIEELLQEGIDAAKAGNKEKARARLQEVVALDQYNEKGWYWLASVVETDEEKKVCLGNVVVINPDNERAQQMLDQLTGGSRAGQKPASGAGRRPGRLILLLVVLILVIAAIPILANTLLRGGNQPPVPTIAVLDGTGTEVSAAPGTADHTTSVVSAPSPSSSVSAAAGIGTAEPTRIVPANTLPPTWTPQPSPTRAGTQTGTPMAPPPAGLTGHLIAVSGTILSRDRSLPLFILDPDGKNMRQLTQGDVGDYGLITPDGQRFIFARYVSSTNAQTLRMSGINGASPAEVSTLWNNQPPLANQQMVNISRNGRVLVFSALSFAENDSTPDIYYVPVKFFPGGEPTLGPTATLGLPPTLPKGKTPPATVGTPPATTSPFVKVSRVTAKDSGINTWPAPSPDGKLVVFAADTSEKGQGSTDLYVIPLEGGKAKDLTGDMPDSSELAPDWSPDGKQIAFQVTPDGSSNSDIYIMNADGSEKVKLVSGQGDNIRPHWSPDGKYIAFSSNRTSKYEIFMIEVATKTIYQVTVTPRTTICTFWGVE
jgi:hypothetical protein